MSIRRREFIKAAGAGLTLAGVGGITGCRDARHSGHVVVIGGGFAGATAAKYLRLWSAGELDVTLIERRPRFFSFPMSNLVVAGEARLEDIGFSYDGLRKHGVRVVQGEATAIDPHRRAVRLADGAAINYDRLVVAPGVGLMWESVPGLSAEIAEKKLPHAWQAGTQTAALRRRLEAMPEDGVFAICVPRGPCVEPAAPYERACLVAHYCKRHKPRAKVLVLDANTDVQAQRPLFMAAWQELYPGMVEYRPDHPLSSVDAAADTVRFEYRDAVKADVINLVPPQRAGDIARQAGLITANKRWCGVDWRTMESLAQPGIHVIGSATLAAPQMPKSAHMSNQQAKLAAAAIVATLVKGMPAPEPMPLASVAYSFFEARTAAHAAAVHIYDANLATYRIAPGASGTAQARSEAEARNAWAWARGLWADTLA